MEDFTDDPNEIETQHQPHVKAWITFRWVITPMGLLKIVQFVTFLMGIILIASKTSGERSSMEFFVFVSSAGWIFVFITIILYILDVYHRLPSILMSNITMASGCALGVAMMLISSGAMMGRNPADDTVLSGGSFGIISMFLLIFETIFYLVRYKRGLPPYGQKEEPVLTDF